jgi:uncharacterized protein (DUF1015 family)
MRLFAFQGIRYRSPDAASRLAAPPFDQIGNELRERLQASHSHHFTHLTRAVASERECAPARAARLHAEWLTGGIIQRDKQPALYPYAIELADGSRRLGVCGLVGIEPPRSSAIRPHEHTVARTVAERLDLLRAVQADLEPILLLSDDRGDLDPLLERAIEEGLPEVAAHRDPDGHLHRLFRLDNPSRISDLRAAIAGRDGVIADGHHRYRVAQLHAEEVGAREGATSCKLAVVTSLAAPALTIEPIHRHLVNGLGEADPGAVVASRRTAEAEGGAALARLVEAAPQPALAVWRPGNDAEVWTLEPRVAPRRFGAAANELAVVLFHTAVLAGLGLGEECWTDGSVEYHADADRLYERVAARGGTGFWTPPMPPEAFAAAVAHGDLLPPKSTRFVPKLVSGLVWGAHDSVLA